MSVGKEIKIIRQKAFMTQVEFSKRINVSFSTVNRWETDKTNPSMAAMKKINDFCIEKGISFEDLQDEWLNSRED